MRIAAVRLCRYDLPLVRPIVLKGREYRVRSGLLIRVEGEGGAWGCGDAAPLPGFSEERIEDVIDEAERVARSITGCVVPPGFHTLTDRFERWLYEHGLSNALACGLQAAVLAMLADAQGKSPAEYYVDRPEPEIAVNALLAGSTEEVMRQASAVRRLGYAAVKLKVGARPIADEVSVVRALRDILGDGIAIRLDANRAWDYDDALVFGRAVSDCRIEYIEEPLRNPLALVAWSRYAGVPAAIDETVAEHGAEDLERWRGVQAAVLKPALLGGYEYTMWLARRARNAGITPVLSAAYESGVGIAGLANLAAALHQPEVAAGLDTYSWLAQDVLRERIDFSGGRIRLAQANRAARTVEALFDF